MSMRGWRSSSSSVNSPERSLTEGAPRTCLTYFACASFSFVDLALTNTGLVLHLASIRVEAFVSFVSFTSPTGIARGKSLYELCRQIDDIAAVDDRFKTRTHVAKLCQVLTHREDYRMFTVLTTDIQPESWREVFDQRVAERLFSHARLVDLFGVPSYRVR